MQKIRSCLASKKLIIIAFVLSWLYWIYLSFASKMTITFDALCYEQIATTIYKNGWVDFFRNGPNREPFYPWLISVSMSVADVLRISYQIVQKYIQFLFLFATQLLSMSLMRKLKLNEITIAAAILYIGFSPAIVNSALSLFSEISTYPFIIGIVLLSVNSWKLLLNGTIKKVMLNSVAVASLFLLALLTKGAFEFILPFFLLPCFFLFLHSIFMRNKKRALRCFAYLAMVLFLFNAAASTYKYLNFRYNGQFAFTNRGACALYGSTVKRTTSMNPKRVLSGITFTFGTKVCQKIFGEEETAFWSFKTDDYFGKMKVGELRKQGLSFAEIDKKLLSLTKKRVFEKPLQYIFTTVIIGARMFFWESTKIGFVQYPDWLAALFNITIFKNSLRLIMFLMTFFAFVYVSMVLIKSKSAIANTQMPESQTIHTLFFMFFMCIEFIGLYSLFGILTRYTFPIVPFYIVMIAYTIETIIGKNKCNSQ